MNHTVFRRAAVTAAAGILAFGLAGCATTSTEPTATPSPSSTHWSYDGADGPAHWDTVAKACKNTSEAHESPIDIVTSAMVSNPAATAVVTHYVPTSFELENNGHTIEAVPEDLTANTIELDGTTYALQQFHFHADSEHTVDGKHSAAELHLVHKSADGKVAVLALLLQDGAANDSLSQLFASIPAKETEEGHEVDLGTPIDLTSLIPTGSLSAQYDGSLTTPPCTEGVRWNVFLTPVSISKEQLAEFTAVYPDNHRPVQPLHKREVDKVPAV